MKTWLKRAAAAVLSRSLLAAPVLAAAETAGSSTLNLSDNTVYTYSTQSVTSDSGKQIQVYATGTGDFSGQAASDMTSKVADALEL